jgi:outer membrane protein assembly factor BamB
MHFLKSQSTSSQIHETDSGSQENNNEIDPDNILICSTNGRIYGIHKENGKCLWRKTFSRGFSTGIISLFVTDSDKVIAGTNGKTSCMDIMTGDIIWINNMKASFVF